MRPLTFAEILSVWERGWNRAPVDRALLLLNAAHPDLTFKELAAMSIGTRDAELVRLSKRTFLDKFACRRKCERCGEELEFQLLDLESRFDTAVPGSELTAEMSGVEVRYRAVSSLDLKGALECPGAKDASLLLLQKCVVGVHQSGRPLQISELSDETLDAIQECIAQADPNAEKRIEITCPQCGNRSNFSFDIVTYFWSELEAHAKRQLWEVHMLAGTYGWSESEILEMTPFRRSLYVAMAQG